MVAAILAELPDAQAIYLFGSAAAGRLRADSDVDLAVLPLVPLEPLVRWNLQEKLAGLLSRSVDLIDLRSASTVMRVQVIANGTLLYEGDAFARADFEATAFSAYARLNEERRHILNDIRATGRVYG